MDHHSICFGLIPVAIIYVRRHTKFITAERLMRQLHTKSVKLVVNVTALTDSVFAQLAGTAGITYFHVPMLDNPYVPIQNVQGQCKK